MATCTSKLGGELEISYICINKYPERTSCISRQVVSPFWHSRLMHDIALAVGVKLCGGKCNIMVWEIANIIILARSYKSYKYSSSNCCHINITGIVCR